LLRQQKEKAIVIARKPLDADFRTETKKQVVEKYGVHVAPRVDTLLEWVERKVLPESAAPTSSEAQTQYERALTLSKSVTDNVVAKSTDRLRLLQEQNPLVKKAAESASATRERYSDIFLAQFNRIIELTTTLSESFKEKAKERAATLPPPVQAAYKEFTDIVTPLVADVREVIVAEAPWSEKLPEVGRRFNTHAAPHVEKVRERVPELKERLPELTDSLRSLPERVSRGKAAFFEHKV